MNSPGPVLLILKTFDRYDIRCLLMGGQACILYGAAEFSKDVDFVIMADDDNLDRLNSALNELDAEVIAVPPFEKKWLDAGLAVHFRCRTPSAEGFRIDVMTHMRGVDDFMALWERRTLIDLSPELTIPLLALPDLVASKKTQRDKDWPMLSRLVDVDYFNRGEQPDPEQICFWLLELRNPDLLVEAVSIFEKQSGTLSSKRPLLQVALGGNHASLKEALDGEERKEREADEAYWAPLRKLLADLRHQR